VDAVILARIQFAFTVGFHYIFPPLSIGLVWFIFAMLTRQLKTGEELYWKMARFWIKILAIVFVAGVVSGITMEFQFGTNWAEYSRYVGDIFGAPLAAEALFAFFLESTFLGILVFGSTKVSKKLYWFSSLMVAVGTTISAFWIIVANSWQQTPRGYEVVNGRVELVDFWAAVFNPSTLPRFFHAIDAALMTGAVFVLGICALYLIRNKHIDFAKAGMKMAIWVLAVTSLLQLTIGHWHMVQVAENQPMKLGAYEGLFETQSNAPLLLFGIPNAEKEDVDYAVRVPGLLSLLLGGSTDTVAKGLKDFPREEWPPLMAPFFSFHMMIAIGMFFILFSLWGVFSLLRGNLFEQKWFMHVAFWAIPLPFIANEVGWIAAEVGRQPWVVQGLLKTSDAVSGAVDATQVLLSLIFFVLIYSLIFAVWFYLMKRKIDLGPEVVK
jgi:cytochrome d ubiquinol oxidase subunit I